MSNRFTSRLLAALAGVALAGAAQADFSTTVYITATDELGNSVPWSYSINQNDWQTVDGSPLDWSNPLQDRYFAWGAWSGGENASALAIGEARLHGFRVQFREDPMVAANFNVQAGAMNTTFTVSSISIGFPTIDASEAIGVATASVTVTDSFGLGTPGSISFSGLQAGGAAYSAFYNFLTCNFSNLITGPGTVAVPQGSTHIFQGASAGTYAAPIYTPVGSNVAEMQSQFRFSLSAFDRAAGTSTFEIVPAPSAVGLLGLGALVGMRRRRA